MLVPPSEMRREPVVRAAAHVLHPVEGEEMRASGSGKPVRIEALLFDWCDEVVQRVGLVDDREDDTGHHVELFEEGKSSGIGHLHVQQQVRLWRLDSGFFDHFMRACPSCRALAHKRLCGCAHSRPGCAVRIGRRRR